MHNNLYKFHHFKFGITTASGLKKFFIKVLNQIQFILRFVTPRFVNTFFGNENVTNRVRGGIHKTKFKILITIFVV